MRTGRKSSPVDRAKYNVTNRLQEFRTKKRPGLPEGYTQEFLAEYLGVGISAVVNAERYGRGLGRKNWYKLATLFDVDPRVLEGYTDTEKNLA